MIKKIVFLLFFFVLLTTSSVLIVKATEAEDLAKKIEEYSKILNELGKTKDSLANQIKIINSQVELTILKIAQTENYIKSLEQEINNLTVEINKLDIQLNELSSLYVLQIVQNYKLQKKVPAFTFLISSRLNNFLEQYKYIVNIQKNSQNTLISMETIRTNYDIQKTAKTKKQQELEDLQKTLAAQKINLANQKAAKNNLLEITKNDEKKYTDLINNAKAELEAINSILAGNGTESESGSVKASERIASVILGESCSSSGTHLHFMVTKNNIVQNPFNYLKPIDYINCSTNTCGGGGDSFNPSGNWNWPLSPKISFNQGYGDTWAIHNTWVRQIYSFHNGIDIYGSSSTVNSSIDGTLYRGSFHIKSRNCYLRYVKVVGSDGINTLNLHVNY